MEVIRLSKNDVWWTRTILYMESCSWVEVGNHLAEMMKQNQFSDWESVFILVEKGDIIGFCTFLKTDYYPENRYSPWISSIFVDEKARGNRFSGKMIETVISYAKEQGFSKVYIPSDMDGFYEKFGFTPIDTLENYSGDFDTIFMKDLCLS